MATSGTYSFSVTRDDIIRQALLNIKRLDPLDSPTPQETEDCARVLNMLAKQWMGKSDFAPGLKIWTRKQGHLLLSNSTGSYTLSSSASGWTNALTVTTLASAASAGAGSVEVSSATGAALTYTIAVVLDDGSLEYDVIDGVSGTTLSLTGTLSGAAAAGNVVFIYAAAAQAPLEISAVSLRDSDNRDTPVEIIRDLTTYFQIPGREDTSNVGDPSAVFLEPGINTATLRLDVGACNDVSKRLVISYFEPVQDFINPQDEPHYPQEWYLALCWGLSEQICPMFGAEWTQKMESLKSSAMLVARNKGAETSDAFFQPKE